MTPQHVTMTGSDSNVTLFSDKLSTVTHHWAQAKQNSSSQGSQTREFTRKIDPANGAWNMDTCASSHLNDSVTSLSDVFNTCIYSSVSVADGHTIPVGHTLGWHLEGIHVTWAHLGKKRTRLQLYTKVKEEKGTRTLETASQLLVTASEHQRDGVRKFETASELNRHNDAVEDSAKRRRNYSIPSHEGYRNTIELPDGNNVVPLLSDTIWIHLHLGGSYYPFPCSILSTGRTSKLRNDILMFHQHQGESLSESWTRFKDLLQNVPHHGIDLWLQIQIFYDHVSIHLKMEIDHAAGGKLRDKNAEESWEIIENLALGVLNEVTTPKKRLNNHEGWNDPRDFAKPVKAISLPQDTSRTLD
ncbi:hypothetical protein Tco_1176779 [Tanacetum coccineum]